MIDVKGDSALAFRERIHGFNNQIFDRRQMCYGREMPESISSSITGIQLRDTLLREAGMDLRKLKSILQEKCELDLKAYFKFKGIETGYEPYLNQFVADTLAGGQTGRRRIFANLEKVNINKSKTSTLAVIADEMVRILSPRAKILNLARYRIRCVRAHLDNLQDLELQQNLRNMYAPIAKELASKSKELLNLTIVNEEDLLTWIKNVHELLFIISSNFPDSPNSDTEDSIQLSSRLKKGFIAKKNLPTYFKHWRNFCIEKLSQQFQLVSEFESETSLTYLYDTLNTNSLLNKEYIEKILEYTKNNSNTSNSLNNLLDNKMIQREFDLNGNKLQILHNVEGIEKTLINSLIKNVEVQLRMNLGIKKLITSVSNLDKRIELVLENASKKDISLLKELLNNL
jgi:hypothetical protein